MAGKNRIRAIGGRHDGGKITDLGEAYWWVGPRGGAYRHPAPGRVLHFRRQSGMHIVDQTSAEAALICLSDLERIRPAYGQYPVGDWSFERYVEALEALASVAKED